MRNSVKFFGVGCNVNATPMAIEVMRYTLIELRNSLMNNLDINSFWGRSRIAHNSTLEDLRWVNEAYLALNGRGSRVRRIAAVESCINCCSANTRIEFNREYKDRMNND